MSIVNYSCLSAKNLLHEPLNRFLIIFFRKQSIDKTLQLHLSWRQPKTTRWPSQPTDYSKCRDGYNSVIVRDIELLTKHSLCARTLLKMLTLTVKCKPCFSVRKICHEPVVGFWWRIQLSGNNYWLNITKWLQWSQSNANQSS